MTLSLNGAPIGADTVEGDGCTTQTLQVQPGATALGGLRLAAAGLGLFAQAGAERPSVLVDGRTVPAVYGTNVLLASGVTSSGAPRVVASTFDVPRPSAVITRALSAPASAARELAASGVQALSPTGVAIVLIAVGAVFVRVSRVRRRRSAAGSRAATALASALAQRGPWTT